MPLDKLTLHAQLALLAQNASGLDAAIAQKAKVMEDAAIDLHHTRGARAYNDLLVTQVNNQLAEVERQEKVAAVAGT